MSDWKTTKRFWKDVTIKETEEGFQIELDGRAIKTPAKTSVVVPTRALAEAIAAEWEAQGEEVDPLSMPVTRCANSALDKVAQQHSEVADMLAEYAGTDLICYRADAPAELVARQAEAWDPLLEWAAATFQARLKPVAGVMFQAQDAQALDRLRQEVHALSNFELAAFHDLVALSGSLILGLAAIQSHSPAEQIWQLSRLDETWQEEQWGRDEEAVEQAEIKKKAFLNANSFFLMCKS